MVEYLIFHPAPETRLHWRTPRGQNMDLQQLPDVQHDSLHHYRLGVREVFPPSKRMDLFLK